MNRVEAVAHPLRAAMLLYMLDHKRPIAPIELATEFDIQASHSAYHMRVLATVGLVELASEEAVRGSIKHYYVLVPANFTEPLVSAARMVVGDG